ncbi:MAG: hypothetical protein J6386_01285 [Candidatus Synoicihabitans palmerolidicus]|nr:hypothetical protein [Candidatus Synoicihabitans palmerolidicus]
MSQVFIEMCGEADRASELGLAAAQPMDTCLVDSTCLQANIHFPVDWVLFRNVSRTPAQGGETAPCSGVAGSDAERAASLCQADESVVHRDDPQPTAPRCEAGPQGRAPPDEAPAAHHRRARPPPPRPPRRRLSPDPLQ